MSRLTVRSKFFVENSYHGMPGAGDETFPLQRDPLPAVGGPGFAGYLEKHRARVEGLAASSKEGHATLAVDKGHRAMLDGFVDSIVHDRPSPCDEMAGYLAVYLARQAIRSIELRQALPLPVDRVSPAIV